MVKYGQIWLNMVRKRWSVVASAIVGVVFDQIDQKSGQKWSKLVKDGQRWSISNI
jgi:hypothetical protein